MAKKLKAYPDFVRMSFSFQQQSCWVFQDDFIKFQPVPWKFHEAAFSICLKVYRMALNVRYGFDRR